MTRSDTSPRSLRPARSHRLRTALLVFAGWTVYGVLFANVIRAFSAVRPRPKMWGLLIYAWSEAWVWALFTAPIVWLARRFPVTTRTWPRSIPLHLGFALFFHCVVAGSGILLRPWVRPGYHEALWETMLSGILFDGFLYLMIVAIVHAFDAQTHALRLQNQLLEADLRVLRMQLQPHFLFNTLNAVSELVHLDPAAAERALTRLGDLLRWTLQSSSQAEVPLREELTALATYLEIQQIRHGEGLRFRVDAAADTLELGVPALLLQPLVENAIRHGIAGAPDGEVVIETRRAGNRLHMSIRDDGRGFVSGHREGTGLRTTRARLAGLYADDQVLQIGPASGRGSEVEIVVPAHLPRSDGAGRSA